MKETIGSAEHDTSYDLLVLQEELILDVTERLTEALDKAGVTKGELAKRLGKSPGFVSQVFGGGRNLTLRTISDIAAVLSLRPTFQLSPDRESWLEPAARWDYEFPPRLESHIPAASSLSLGNLCAA